MQARLHLQVVLPEVNPPPRQLSNVRRLVPFTPWIAGAGLLPRTSVEPKLQAQGMYFIDGVLDAVRPLRRVGNQLSTGITALCRPTIVDVDVWIQGSALASAEAMRSTYTGSRDP